MFELPIDAWYVWIGVAVVSIAVLGLVSAFPTTPPPDAVGAADTIDEVAAGSYPASATHHVVADRIAIGPHTIKLDGEGGRTSASLSFGPITPAFDDQLRPVLAGTPPNQVFDNPVAFHQAAIEASAQEPEWHRTSGKVRVRQVHWGSVRVTLTG